MTERALLVGQKLAAGFEGTRVPEDFRALVKRLKVGNVILFKRNIESAGQLRALCAELCALIEGETGRAPFIALDQEGGVVSRLSADCTLTPSAMALSAGGEEEDVAAAARIIGRELSALGVNMDLAPVLDVNSNPRNPVIGVRSFGGTPQRVAKLGAAYVRALQESGVIACVKHFPGHGDTDVDSHLGLPRIDKNLASLERCELAPFRAAIEAGGGGRDVRAYPLSGA